ncbi:MAG TPA: hypothetical protein VNW25_06410 [Candidatus Sulfotelmatobacter sp.]|nr:hypothetical protein [Candidatus Sulfotelmatobacter sp.]
MIRGIFCAILIILSLFPAIPLSSRVTNHTSGPLTNSAPIVAGHDPAGSLAAFNVSRAQFDLYTQLNATSTLGTPISWFGGNFTNPQNGTPIPGTTFNVTIPSGAPPTNDNVTFNKVLNVPKGNFSSTTYLRFTWLGTSGNHTKASYYVYNDTSKAPIFSDTKKNMNFTGGGTIFTSGSPPVGCGPKDNCFDVTSFMGFNLTLVFAFNTTATGRGSIRVSNVAIASADHLPISSYSHTMRLDPTDPTRMRVNHNANLTTTYFANVTYPKPIGTGHLNHTWSRMILSYYYPNSYASVQIVQNGTIIFPTTSPASPIFEGNCPNFFFCRDSHLVSLSMSTGIKRAGINVSVNSVNLSADVKTTLGGVPTTTWGTGDFLQVRVTLRQGVNATGLDYVSANKTGVVRVTQTFANTKEGNSLLNFTNPIPQDTTLFGQWTVNSTFTNGYDFGYNSTSFTLEQLGVTGFSYSGSNQRLNTQGTLAYSPTNPSNINVNGYVFAIDNGAGAAPLTTPTISSGTGVYASNVSLVNGVFTSGQPLMVFFSLVNSAYAANSAGTKMNASLTIDHEFVSGMTHGSSVTIRVPSGYDTFTLHSDYVFELDATFTPAGIQIVVKGITAGGTPISATLPPGNPPVTSLRQHAGLFKITVKSQPTSGSGACVPSCTSSIESPAYAYVLVNAPSSGRLLASGGFASGTNGAYSATISSGRILGATKLVFLTLGIDPTGFAITVQGQSSQESTLLHSSLDSIPSVTLNQPVSLVLHLKSNSTTVNMNVTITLNIQDSTGAIKASENVSGIIIAPGQTKDAQFNFNAPLTVGAYSLTFSSPDYGAPLITGTLQVSVLQSILQAVIPAIIGIVAAIVILLFFLFRKKPQAVPETSAKDKPSGVKPAKPNPGSPISKSLT